MNIFYPVKVIYGPYPFSRIVHFNKYFSNF